MANVPTIDELLVRSEQIKHEAIQLNYRAPQALQLIADVLIALIAELQAQKPRP